jgi:hypothetical protein
MGIREFFNPDELLIPGIAGTAHRHKPVPVKKNDAAFCSHPQKPVFIRNKIVYRVLRQPFVLAKMLNMKVSGLGRRLSYCRNIEQKTGLQEKAKCPNHTGSGFYKKNKYTTLKINSETGAISMGYYIPMELS